MPDSRVSSLTSVPSVAFDAGQLTSDGGLVWLAQADDRLGLSASFSAQMRDWRRGPVRHALVLRQRLLQIACGYKNQNDADTLLHDLLLKLVCGRHPFSKTYRFIPVRDKSGLVPASCGARLRLAWAVSPQPHDCGQRSPLHRRFHSPTNCRRACFN